MFAGIKKLRQLGGKHDAKDTYWIAFHHVLYSRDLGNGETCLFFTDGSEIKIPLSYKVWESRKNNGEKLFCSIKRI